MQKFNFQRKLFHLLGFGLPLVYYFDIFRNIFGLVHGTRTIVVGFLVINIIIVGVSEYLRLSNPKTNEFYMKAFGKLMKENEKDRITGTLPYLISNLIVVLLFPPEIYFLTMVFLLIGDPMAAYFGANYGTFRFYNGKSLVGIIAFITASILFGFLLVLYFQFTERNPRFSIVAAYGINWSCVMIVILGGLTAGIAEFFSGHALMGLLEDNLTITLSSAIVMIAILIFIFHVPTSDLLFSPLDLFDRY